MRAHSVAGENFKNFKNFKNFVELVYGTMR